MSSKSCRSLAQVASATLSAPPASADRRCRTSASARRQCYDPAMPWDLSRLAGAARAAVEPPSRIVGAADRRLRDRERVHRHRRGAGLTREQVELALEDSRLTIRGQRRDRARRATSCTSIRSSAAMARSRGRSSSPTRSTSTVTADLADGVLTITLPEGAAAARAQDSSAVSRHAGLPRWSSMPSCSDA